MGGGFDVLETPGKLGEYVDSVAAWRRCRGASFGGCSPPTGAERARWLIGPPEAIGGNPDETSGRRWEMDPGRGCEFAGASDARKPIEPSREFAGNGIAVFGGRLCDGPGRWWSIASGWSGRLVPGPRRNPDERSGRRLERIAPARCCDRRAGSWFLPPHCITRDRPTVAVARLVAPRLGMIETVGGGTRAGSPHATIVRPRMGRASQGSSSGISSLVYGSAIRYDHEVRRTSLANLEHHTETEGRP